MDGKSKRSLNLRRQLRAVGLEAGEIGRRSHLRGVPLGEPKSAPLQVDQRRRRGGEAESGEDRLGGHLADDSVRARVLKADE